MGDGIELSISFDRGLHVLVISIHKIKIGVLVGHTLHQNSFKPYLERLHYKKSDQYDCLIDNVL